VRIGKLIAMDVMMSVSRAPLDWVSLNSENSQESQRVLNEFWCDETFMGKLSVVRDGNTLASCHVAPEEHVKSSWTIGEWSKESKSMD
jgi:hypothetical protein